jgi:hypothetical protein
LSARAPCSQSMTVSTRHRSSASPTAASSAT